MDTDTIGPDTPARTAPAGATSAKAGTRRRDAQAARRAADERLETAERIRTAVDEYHSAADRIDAAQHELVAAGAARLEALTKLREAKLTITEMVELTGLSSSRIQALLRNQAGGR